VSENTVNTNESTVGLPVIILTPGEFLRLGLTLLGWVEAKLERAKDETNVGRFTGHFGCMCCALWEDLQTTEIEEARIDGKHRVPKLFLMSLHF